MSDLDWFQRYSDGFQGELRYAEPLSRHTYYRIGGPASIMAFPKSQPDLNWLKSGIREAAIPTFVLGLGSNLLVSDEGFSGLVIKTSRLDLAIETFPDPDRPEGLILRTGASVAVSSLLRRAAQEGWSGLEFLAGVPGSVGGVVVMNAGTHLGEVKQKVHRLSSFLWKSGATKTWSRSDMSFDYRQNHFLPEDAIITSVEWRVDLHSSESVKKKIEETLERRKATQPVDYPSCGSVFKNPGAGQIRAWQVIDQLGLRGFRIGNAQFSEKHSNFIVNLGEARAVHVRDLIELAKSRAKEELGLHLEEEVKFLGKF
ncbi:MAG: UDP-N-acetylmuramate dehydrogenase [Bdellovibrionales bacterium]|nr:UDP-N-acetylmuramate dehydrogenase [Bdellovibrionales bacterium]